MLSNRWSILALLFGVRCAMGIQFQSVPAVAPLYLTNFALTIADLGSLIGLYFAPGIFLALPGGALGQKFGEKRLVIIGLGLMAAGSLIMAFGEGIGILIFGRLVAGVGGILMNVLMSKMVTDWFAGKEIATAMGYLCRFLALQSGGCAGRLADAGQFPRLGHVTGDRRCPMHSSACC